MSKDIKTGEGFATSAAGDYQERPVTWDVRPWETKGDRSKHVIVEGYTSAAGVSIMDDFWAVLPPQGALELARAIIKAVEQGMEE